MSHSTPRPAIRITSCLVALLVSPTVAHADDTGGSFVGVHLVSRVGEAEPDDRPKRALARSGVTLHAVLVVREAAGLGYFSDAGPFVELAGRRHAARPLAEAPPARFRWYKVEPRVENLSNTAGGRFHFEPIPYGESEVAAWAGRSSVTADVRPTLTTDRGGGAGTMRFKVVATAAGASFATPGAEARRGRGSGGLTDAVHRVTLRRDDTYLGFLSELYGQPYIWASAGTSDAAHQSERLEGADCADFVVYGRRRLGEARAYTWTGALPQVTRRLSAGRPGPRGVYLDERGAPIEFSRAGDLILFPRHVGVLVEDRGDPGVLDEKDVMVHAYFASPREQPIGDTDYRAEPVELRRWR